jgi:hypothetical protein
MSNYLVIGGWSSRRKIPVEVIAETAEGVQIKAIERIFLPGRGMLKEGQSACVPKQIIMLGDGD